MFFCKKTPRFSRGAHNWGACAFRVAHMTGAQDWFLPELLPGDVDLGPVVDDIIDVQQQREVVGV